MRKIQTLMNKKKELYVAPGVTVIDVKSEGVICASSDLNNGFGVGSGMFEYDSPEQSW